MNIFVFLQDISEIIEFTKKKKGKDKLVENLIFYKKNSVSQVAKIDILRDLKHWLFRSMKSLNR